MNPQWTHETYSKSKSFWLTSRPDQTRPDKNGTRTKTRIGRPDHTRLEYIRPHQAILPRDNRDPWLIKWIIAVLDTDSWRKHSQINMRTFHLPLIAVDRPVDNRYEWIIKKINAESALITLSCSKITSLWIWCIKTTKSHPSADINGFVCRNNIRRGFLEIYFTCWKLTFFHHSLSRPPWGPSVTSCFTHLTLCFLMEQIGHPLQGQR